MMPKLLIDIVDQFSSYDVMLACESLLSLYGTHDKYPFTKASVDRPWSKSDLLHYFNGIDFDNKEVIGIEQTMYMVIMAVFSTILTQKRLIGN